MDGITKLSLKCLAGGRYRAKLVDMFLIDFTLTVRTATIETGFLLATIETGFLLATIETGFLLATIETGFLLATIETGFLLATIETGFLLATIETGFLLATIETGFLLATIETGFLLATIETGFLLATIETGFLLATIETGFLLATIETGFLLATIETGFLLATIETGFLLATIETGFLLATIETGFLLATIETGFLLATIETGFLLATIETGFLLATIETGFLLATIETGFLLATIETGFLLATIETGFLLATIETGFLLATIETGFLLATIETGFLLATIETTIETGFLLATIETGFLLATIETGFLLATIETGFLLATIETGFLLATIETGFLLATIETGFLLATIETGFLLATIETGFLLATIETGFLLATIETGFLLATIETGFLLATIETGFLLATIETGFLLATIETGFLLATIETGFLLATIETGFLLATIETGFLLATIETGFLLATIETGFLLATIETGFLLATIETGFLLATIKTGFLLATIDTKFCLATRDKKKLTNSRMSREKSSEVHIERTIPKPPDGGWGWMVVFSSFMIHIIADGIVYSFGIFYMEFLDYFKSKKGETAWIGSLVPGVTLSVGPIASALTNRYGCRPVTIAGALIAASGFILSLFAPNIYYLYVSFGILSGVGFGLIYLPAIVSVGYYFESKRAFATGLAVCGSGIGAFIFAPLSKWLLDQYDWKGACLIQAGLILNCVVCGCLFRPLQLSKMEYKSNYSVEYPEEDKHESEALMGSKQLEVMSSFSDQGDDNINHTFESTNLSNGKTPLSLRVLQLRDTNGALFARSDGALNTLNGVLNDHCSPSRENMLVRRQFSQGANTGPMYRKDIFYSASLLNIPMYKSHPELYVTSITSIPDQIGDSQEWRIFRIFQISPEFRDVLREMLDFSLLKDGAFLMFAISNFCTSIGFNMPFIYLPDRAVEAGIDKSKAAFLISVIGIANTISRVTFGWLSDKPWVNRLVLYSTSLLICGIATAFSPFGDSYAFLVGVACVFGLFIGVYVSLTSVVLVDLLGLDKLTNSFGLLLMFQGVATLIGPPIAGWLYDATGNYNISFHLAGAVVALSGIILYFIPCVQRYSKKSRPATRREIKLGKQIKFDVGDPENVEGQSIS
ncbi:hypothetical protein ScPMuIL_018237 [Solemya velum]